LPEIANKLNVPIQHYDFGQPMQFDDIIKEKDNYSGCIRDLRVRDEVSYFGESVNHY